MKRLWMMILVSMFVTGVGLAQATPNGIALHQDQTASAKVTVIQAKSGAHLDRVFGNKRTIAEKSSHRNSYGHGSLLDSSIGEVDSSETVEASISSLEPPETEVERLERISGIPSRP